MGRTFALTMFDPDNQIAVHRSGGFEAAADHAHDFFEMVFILEGEGVHILSDSRRKRKVSVGDCFLVPVYASHAIFPKTDQPFRWLDILIAPAIWEGMAESLFAREEVARFAGDTEMLQLMEQIAREYEEGQPYFQTVLKGLLTVAVGKIQRVLRKKEQPEKTSGLSGTERAHLEKAIRYIDENYKSRPTLEVIAKEVGISTWYLDKLFKGTQTTPIDYQNQLRIEEACRLLLTTRKSVVEIIEETGYGDQKFFYGQFKRKIGMTPGQYRASKLN
ncbi:MAG: helix-turn-helix domain-containing protein [Oscillospiraceae bacterium]|jgi:AraC-like DNA-binding protein/mannose-6-phosphate isomerase-like protein (cupin superfamily)|nr:helix-turn-helix domain-containing protein [Oscillospiraceae bacterium]